MKRRHETGTLMLIALMVFQGCIFSPRKAEPPNQGEEDTWIIPYRPKDVFSNLASGFASTRDSNYDRSLDPSFSFIPRPEDAALPGTDFTNWTKDVELQVLRRIKSDYPAQRLLQFGRGTDMLFDKENIEGTKAFFEGPYLITLDPGTGSKQTFAGIARFSLIQGSQGWVITTWQDLDVNGNFSTSGYLRGTLRASGG